MTPDIFQRRSSYDKVMNCVPPQKPQTCAFMIYFIFKGGKGINTCITTLYVQKVKYIQNLYQYTWKLRSVFSLKHTRPSLFQISNLSNNCVVGSYLQFLFVCYHITCRIHSLLLLSLFCI